MLKATPAGHPLWVDSVETVSARAAVNLVAALQARLAIADRAVLMLAVDHAMDVLYQLLASRFRRALDWRRVCVVQSDELLGLAASDLRSSYARLDNSLLTHLDVGEILAITGPRQAAPALFDREIEARGGIDVAVHSLGQNGQIALNGPGSPFSCGARLAPSRGHDQQSSDEDILLTPQTGVTIGLKTVAETRFNLVFALGESRAWAAAQSIYGPVAEGVPASLLQRVNNVHYYLDHRAYGDCRSLTDSNLHREIALEF